MTTSTITLPTTKEEEKTFNVYKSTMASHKLVTSTGKVLSIVDYQLITNNAEDIEFLDAEVKAGFPFLSKAEQVTSTELDPMAKLRAKMKEEARQEILAETKDSNYEAAKAKPASTATLSALAAGSNSAPAK